MPVTTYRITSEDIEAIIDFDPSIEDLTPFIAAAEELVTELCAGTLNQPVSEGFRNTTATPWVPYTSNRLAIIETWLAAHFLAIRDPRYASESIGAASASYQQMVGLNLGLTPYGQQAMLFDTHGNLAWMDKHISQGKRARAGVAYLGTCRPFAQNRIWRYVGVLMD